MSHKYPKTGKRGAPQAFARKLYEILCTESPSVISWSDAGDSFFINDPDEFVNNILLKYFRHQKFSSFQRQLNLYGFRKVHKGPDTGSYSHQCFRRDEPDLLDVIRRAPQSNSRGRSTRQRQPSCDDDLEDDDEDYREDDEESFSGSTSAQAPSCISTLTNCFSSTGAYNTRAAAQLPPPPSYDDVLKADMGLDTGVQPSLQRLKRGLSDHGEKYEPHQRQRPYHHQQQQHQQFLHQQTSAPSGVFCFSNMPYNPTILSDDMFNQQLSPNGLTINSCEFNGPFDFTTFDNSIWDQEEEVQQETDMEFSTTVKMEQVEQKYYPPPQMQYQPVPRPSFNRMFSTQSQEWEIDNSIANDLDFDDVLGFVDAFTPMPTATPVGYRAAYPVAQAEVVHVTSQQQHGGGLIPPRTNFSPHAVHHRQLPPVPFVNMQMYSRQNS